MNARHLIALALCCTAACAETPFRPTFKSPERPKPEQIAAELASVPPRQESTVIVAVAAEPTRLVAWDLTRGLLWQAETNAQSAPIVAGNCVVTQEADEVVVRSLANGARQVALDDDYGRLVSADGEGDACVISLAHAAAETGEPLGTLAFVNRGSVRWTQELNLAVGSPALVRGYVLVPWATHRLSVIDSEDGAELARWYFNAAVLGHARVDRGRVYVGQHGLFRVRQELLTAKVDTVELIAPALRSLPAQPPLLVDGYAVRVAPDNAQHRVSLEHRPAAENTEGDGLEHDMYFARYYRMVFGLAAKEDQVRFATLLESDAVGAQVVLSGLLVVETSGAVRVIDYEGRPNLIAQLPGNLIAASVRAGSIQLAPSATPPAAPPALETQLLTIANVDDARLAMGRQYAVDQLARSKSGEVTGELVALCSDDKAPESVRRSACGHLSERENGGDAVLAILRDEERARAHIGALAKAAAGLSLRAAGALLTPHVLDPRTHASELPQLISALATLEHAPAAAEIDRFLRLHHAEPEGSELAPALHAATAALGALRARPYRATLERVHADALTAEGVRKAASDALIAFDAPPPAKVAARTPAEDKAAAVAAAPAKVAAPTPDARPRYLSAELIDQALKPVAKKLQACLSAGANANTNAQARVSMTINGGGEVERVFVTPPDTQSCVEPLVRAQRFPATQQGRQNVAHVVRARAEKVEKAEKPGKPEKAKASRTLARAPKQP
jgi:hypothetical protein